MKIIVLDANILIRAVLGIRTFSLVAEHRDKVFFCTPQPCYAEVAFHIPNIARKRNITSPEQEKALETLNALKQLVVAVNEDVYEVFKQEALNRIGEQDEKD